MNKIISSARTLSVAQFVGLPHSDMVVATIGNATAVPAVYTSFSDKGLFA